MFQYYNAHPYQLEVEDCVKRAITVTTNMDYRDVQRGLNQHKKITGAQKFNSCENPRSYVENVLGFLRVAVPASGDGTPMTVDAFCRAHPKGRFIISVLGHWSAVINGTILDTWDCSNEILLSYYCVSHWKERKGPPIQYGFLIKQISSENASVRFYDGNGYFSEKIISARQIEGYRACLLDMGRHEAIDWEDARWQ